MGLSMKEVAEEVEDDMKQYMTSDEEHATLGDVMGEVL